MRHCKKKFKLGKPADQRKALIRSLLRALIKEEKIVTTYRRAKEASKWADRLITLGKQDSLHARRQAFRFLQDRDLVNKLFSDVAPRFRDINGGYTRVIKYQNRKGDNAMVAILEFTRIKEELLEEKRKLRLLRREKKRKELAETEVPLKEVEVEEKVVEEAAKEEKKTKKEEKPKVKRKPEQKKTFLQGLKGFFRKRER